MASMKFTSTSAEDVQLWWNSFNLFKNVKELTNQRALAIFPLMLKDGAMTWYLGQSTATKANWAGLQDTFKERYFPQEINKWKQTWQVWSMKQRTGQSATDFMAAVELEVSRAGIEEDQLRCVIIQGLLPNIRQFEVTREGNDVNSLRRWLTVADAAAVPDPKDEISLVIKDIQKLQGEMHVHAVYPLNCQGRESPRSTSQSPMAHRIQFSVPA